MKRWVVLVAVQVLAVVASAQVPVPEPEPSEPVPPPPGAQPGQVSPPPGYGYGPQPQQPYAQPQQPYPQTPGFPNQAQPAPQPNPNIPHRSGFTLELGLGVSMTQASPEVGDSSNRFGIAPLSLSVGGFVTESLALILRMAGTSYFEDVLTTSSSQVVLGFYGAHLQVYLNDRFMISGGAGLALWGDVYEGGDAIESGWALGLRGGYAVIAKRHHTLRVSLEIIPAFFDAGTVVGEALIVEWQYH